MSNEQKMTADQVKALLGTPRLIRGESEEAYWKWWSTLAEAYNPESFPDWLLLNDYATKSWEQRRLQRSNAILVEEAFMKALENLLWHDESGRNTGLGPAERYRVVEQYYYGNEKAKRFAAEEVQYWGITDDHIIAEAMRLRAARPPLRSPTPN